MLGYSSKNNNSYIIGIISVFILHNIAGNFIQVKAHSSFVEASALHSTND